MWHKINCTEWKLETSKLQLPIFYDSDFLNSTANTFNLNIDYFCFNKKGKIIALGAFFIKGTKIVRPENFSFTALWFSEELSDVAYIEIAEVLIQLLKNNYSKISLKLNSQISDIRPFTWANFKIEIKYTYIKKNDLAPHYSVSKNLSKLEKDHYVFKVQEIDNNSWQINLKFLKKLGFSISLCSSYQLLLFEWDKIGILKALNVYKKKELICSNIVLFDKDNHKLYTILLNSVNIEEKHAHTFLYTSIFNWCKENGISDIDLCGANLKSVSKFKSYFNADLTPYFSISYSSINNKLINLKRGLKSIAKVIKSKMN